MTRIDLDSPRYDQSTFEGRAKYFFITTNPLNSLATDIELDKARDIVIAYRAGKEDKTLTDDQIWAAKQLYDSAFHPQTGEKLFLPGRMSFQVSIISSIAYALIQDLISFLRSPVTW
jgi:hypothetical protein